MGRHAVCQSEKSNTTEQSSCVQELRCRREFRLLRVSQRACLRWGMEPMLGHLRHCSKMRTNKKFSWLSCWRGRPAPVQRWSGLIWKCRLKLHRNPRLAQALISSHFMPSPCVKTTNVSELSCTRRWQERAVPVRCQHRPRSTPLTYLP